MSNLREGKNSAALELFGSGCVRTSRRDMAPAAQGNRAPLRVAPSNDRHMIVTLSLLWRRPDEVLRAAEHIVRYRRSSIANMNCRSKNFRRESCNLRRVASV
jgi:hypothetical protein